MLQQRHFRYESQGRVGGRWASQCPQRPGEQDSLGQARHRLFFLSEGRDGHLSMAEASFSWPSSLKYFLGGKRELEACWNTLCLPRIPPACRESKRGAVWEEDGSGMELSPVAVPTRGFSCWGACPTTGTLRAQDTAHGPSCTPDLSRVPHP